MRTYFRVTALNVFFFFFIHLTFRGIILHGIQTATGVNSLSCCQTALGFQQANSYKPVETADDCRAGRRQVCAALKTQQVLQREEQGKPSAEMRYDCSSPTTKQVESQQLRRNQYSRTSRNKTILFAKSYDSILYETVSWHDEFIERFCLAV